MLRFILVNDRTPHVDPRCASCCTTINGSYVREFGTHLCYCSARCFAGHLQLAQLVTEHRAKAAP